MTDIALAQKLVENNYINHNKDIYNNDSFIFITTNEKIKFYMKYLKDREKVLSVISSGDQILNTILEGSMNIDAFDISRFPKYLLELKKSAILNIELEDYIDMFFNVNSNHNDYYDDIYYSIRKDLNTSIITFWDSLMGFYDWSDILDSRLFSSQTVSLKSTIDNNPYLDKDNYMILKNKLRNATINYYTGDIKDISRKLNNEYDLINLSSIIYYVKNYKDILNNLSLSDNGIALTYLYSVEKEFINYYDNCIFDKFDNSNEGVMIYKK